MTIDIAKLRELLESPSTPRPWRADGVIVLGPNPDNVCDCSLDNPLKGATLDAARSDAALIAAAINALPELLAVFEAASRWERSGVETDCPDAAELRIAVRAARKETP